MAHVRQACKLTQPGRTLLTLGTLCCLLLGCTALGPDAIRSGRLAYNEAITETNNQQILMVPVHNRYEESNHLLAVASVTANVRVSSRAQIQAGFGDSDNYDGNLVPFSGGFIYEQNPTISYMPVTGESYLRQLTSSVPLSLFAQISQSRPYPEFAYTMLISSVNDIRNPSFLFGSQQDDPRFNRFVAIMTELTQEQRLHWVADPQQRERFDLVIDPASQQNTDRTDELLELLGLSGLEQRGKRLIIPVSPALSGAKSGGIGITTRTIWELVEILSAAVQVPADDEKSGIAAAFPRPGEAGRALRVHYASSSPERAYVAVEYRNGWFYIDSADQATKRYFKLLGGLWSAVMAESLGATSAPVLTVPVSR